MGRASKFFLRQAAGGRDAARGVAGFFGGEKGRPPLSPRDREAKRRPPAHNSLSNEIRTATEHLRPWTSR